MVAAGITVHYVFALLGALPSQRLGLQEMIAFEIDYTFWLNLVFIAVVGVLVWLHWRGGRPEPNAEPVDARPERAGR